MERPTAHSRVPLADEAGGDGPDEEGPETPDAVEEEVDAVGGEHCWREGEV